MLKSTITPAVIKGQKEYHQKLVQNVKKWIKSHPADFGGNGAGAEGQGAGVEEIDLEVDSEVVTAGGRGTGTGTEKTLWDHAMDVTENPILLGVGGLCVLLLLVELYQLFSGPRGEVIV